MKTPRRTPRKPTPKKKPSPFALTERRFPGRKVVQFPQIQGRTVERVRLFTSKDDHCISINFQDKTLLSLHFGLGFNLSASLSDVKTGNFRVIREWPPIHSEPRSPE